MVKNDSKILHCSCGLSGHILFKENYVLNIPTTYNLRSDQGFSKVVYLREPQGYDR